MKTRIVAVQAEGHPEPDPPWIPVGVVAYGDAPARRIVVIKATFRAVDGRRLGLAPHQEPLSRGVASALPGAVPGELAAPDDFVPGKVGADVVVTGSAFAPTAVTAIDAAVRIRDFVRRFAVRAGAAATSIPLSATYLAPGDAVGPVAVGRHVPGDATSDAFDLRVFNAAPESQRIADLRADDTIVLEGLVPRAQRAELVLPGLAPVVTARVGEETDRRVEMRCDTLWIDTARALVTLTWRGELTLPEGSAELLSLLVSLERAGAERAEEERLAAMQRGRVGFVVGAEDEAAQAELDDDDRAALDQARYATWRSKAPPPRMPLAEYAHLAALCAERPDERASVLARAGLDEDRFVIEERAWLEKVAREAGDGDATLAADLARELGAAQARVAIPRELDLAAYADLSVELERSEDPAAVFRARNLSIPQWLRVDRQWTDAADADPTTRAALGRALASARARIPEPPDDDLAGEAEGES